MWGGEGALETRGVEEAQLRRPDPRQNYLEGLSQTPSSVSKRGGLPPPPPPSSSPSVGRVHGGEGKTAELCGAW